MEASLTCAVCLSLFEEPVTLPLCSHNFCRDCVLECLASAEAARLQQQRGQGQARLSRGGPGQGAGGAAAATRVSCPLCRKLCPLPRGGAAALPVNTTLAEVVKLYRSGTAGAAKAAEAEQGPGPGLFSPLPLGGTCQKHPSRLVQLYCRMCRQAGCGQCVSEEHQGIFHSVNLIDTVYQEEKLTFFSSLKKLRIINEKLMNEISSHPDDTDIMLTNEAEIIALEFGEIFKTLEMKKKQLLDDVENQRSKKEKEFQVWKKMKETHKKTIENFLKDCEKLVHECDPQCFLEVACGLNTRMKTQLDLMNIASSYEKPPEYTQKKMDIKPVVNEILALKLIPVNVGVVKDLPSQGNENSANNTVSKNNVKQWKDQKNIPNMFLPVAGQEEALADGGRICTRLMSISEMSAFQNMSHEELRYKYYMEHQKLSHEFKIQTLPANKKYKCVTTEALKNKSSGVPFVSSSTKANNADRVKMGSLQRADGFDEISFSSTSNQSIPSTNLNFSETNSDFKFFHEKRSQEISTLALSENSNGLVMKEKIPVQSSAVMVSNEMDANSSASSGLKPSASVPVTVSGSAFLDISAERVSASPFAFSACNNSLPRFIKDAATVSFTKKDSKSIFPTFYLGKCDPEDKIDDQDETKFMKLSSVTKTTVSNASTSPNLESAESEKPVFSFAFGNSERDRFTVSGASNSFKVLPLPSFFNQSEKPSDQNATRHMGENTVSPNEAIERCMLNPSVLLEQTANTSESITTVAYSTSETSTAAGVNDVSETPLHHSNYVFSFANNCLQLPSPVFSFGGIVKNTSDSLTSSSVLFSKSGTKKNEKKKTESPDKTLLNLEKSVSLECTEPASKQSGPKCADSFFPMNSSKKVENEKTIADSNSSFSQPLCSAAIPDKEETASFTQLTTSTKQEIKVKDEDGRITAENNYSCARKEDEPESVLFQNEACSVPDTCSDSFLGGSTLIVNEAGGIPSDTDSDTEELSQTSTSSDNSSASEYFSVAEDKISARGKSET
ncbi:serine-rich adhesin for platelets-like [Apteryx mantelli]|uniref:Serine-rich adhesin for platelets-like n=1 Tax=Apteryx mantelli TaxID=2696672 RepID=A0ABM4EMS4_9AVES